MVLMGRTRQFSGRRGMPAVAAVLLISAAFGVAATTAKAYEDTWGWKTCSGCELQDPGGYHRWEWIDMKHVGGTAMKRSCALAWNGGAWEYGSGCDEGRSETYRNLPYQENALAVAQGWSELGGELTIAAAAVG
jgi:hypothetical protein